MKPWMVVAVIVTCLALGSVGTVVVQQVFPDQHASSPDGAADRQPTSASTASGLTTAPTSPTAATSTATSATVSASPSTTATASASASTSPTPSSSPSDPLSASHIETTSTSYFGRPFETIHIAGTYVGVHAATELRVQVREAEGWTSFPLPVVTRPSGDFDAYVEMGAGQYRLRVLDPATGTTSGVLTLLLF